MKTIVGISVALLLGTLPRPATLDGGARADLDRGAAERAKLLTLLHHYELDEKLLGDFFPVTSVDIFQARRERLAEFSAAVAGIDEPVLPSAGRVDLLLVRGDLERTRQRLEWEAADFAAAGPLVPFVELVIGIERSERRAQAPEGQAAAAALDAITSQVKGVRGAKDEAGTAARGNPFAVRAAIRRTREARGFLEEWQRRDGPADPELAFWTAAPMKAALEALADHAKWLEGDLLENLKKSPAGSPFAIGRDRYVAELGFEGIAISPEEMLGFGEQQLEALHAEIAREAARHPAAHAGATVGSPSLATWQQGLEFAKDDQAPVGDQKEFVNSVALEAIQACREWRLFPIPPLAEDCWRLKLSDLQTQGTYAYGYYGRNFMGVASPLPEMDSTRKLECMKSNARPFTRTVVPHELIPGHHLQGFYASRFEPHRDRFSSPFYGEGWAVHTEMTLDEHGFFRTPVERIGHLFWRLLRAARIVVSTKYHLRQMTQAEMVDFMVDNAGLERSAAQAEVERYMTYSPLYQCAYLYGCWQIRELRRECRTAWGAGFTELRFNTAILEQGSIPIRYVRAALLPAP